MFAHLRKIEKGKTVTIEAMGMVITGTVLTADNWDYSYSKQDKEDWYIELIDTNGTYRYWKQGLDGGKLLEVK